MPRGQKIDQNQVELAKNNIRSRLSRTEYTKPSFLKEQLRDLAAFYAPAIAALLSEGVIEKRGERPKTEYRLV